MRLAAKTTLQKQTLLVFVSCRIISTCVANKWAVVASGHKTPMISPFQRPQIDPCATARDYYRFQRSVNINNTLDSRKISSRMFIAGHDLIGREETNRFEVFPLVNNS